MRVARQGRDEMVGVRAHAYKRPDRADDSVGSNPPLKHDAARSIEDTRDARLGRRSAH